MALSPAQYSTALSAPRQRWVGRPARRLPAAWPAAALVLLRRDLDPARPRVRTRYAPGPRGRPPYDPVCGLQALLRMLLLHYKSLAQGADDLRTQPRLAPSAGLAPCQPPAVGPCSTFIARLAAGPSAPPGPQRVRPSRRRKGPHRRHRQQERAQRHATPPVDTAHADAVTERLARELLATAAPPRPHDLLTRWEDVLCTGGVWPAAQRGRLGTLPPLVRCGDGATRPTGASAPGRPTCACRAPGMVRGAHARFSTDATAPWGSDASRDPDFFGHRYVQYCGVPPRPYAARPRRAGPRGVDQGPPLRAAPSTPGASPPGPLGAALTPAVRCFGKEDTLPVKR